MNRTGFLFLIVVSAIVCSACQSTRPGINNETLYAAGAMLDSWHKAAAEGDSSRFFGLMTPDAQYLGTDETERWHRNTMIHDLGKHFDGTAAWHFIPYDRHFTPTGNNKMLHFDESLRTWMGPCRGSGLLQMIDGKWYVHFYNLANLVPNARVKEYIKILPAEQVLEK